MKSPKIDDGGAAARAEQARIAAEQSAANLKKNLSADLTTENAGTVVAGGTAEAAAVDTALKKKKSAVGSLSSALGLNTQ